MSRISVAHLSLSPRSGLLSLLAALAGWLGVGAIVISLALLLYGFAAP